MNRVKLWVFTLLVVAAGYALVRNDAVTRRAEAVASLDARLAAASSHVSASLAALARETTAAVALVAKDTALDTALHAKEAEPPPPPPPAKGKKARPQPPPLPRKVDPEAEEAKVRDAARAALDKTEKAYGFELPPGSAVTAGNREWLARKGEPSASEGEAISFLRGAIGGQSRRGPLRLNGALWYAAARPVGDGAGVVLLVPLDERWAKSIATAAGVDVTLIVPELKATITTGKPFDAPALQGATRLAGAGDVGAAAPVDVSFGPVKVPHLPQPFAGGAPLRARAVPIDGVKGAYLVLSIPAAAQVDAPAAAHWRGVAGLAGILLVGVVLGFFVRSTESMPQVPEPLYAAAARIEKGDFAARAPKLAGKLGTVAAALNKAAEIAGPAKALAGAPPAPATTGEWYTQQQGGGAAPEELRAPTAMGMPGLPLRTGMVAAVSAPAPEAAFEVDEETHWQQVFQDFLRTRTSCGEATDGLTYEKFRQKLEGNKGQLVAKYGCKTVRFQVYVKDGKAALKATPVK